MSKNVKNRWIKKWSKSKKKQKPVWHLSASSKFLYEEIYNNILFVGACNRVLQEVYNNILFFFLTIRHQIDGQKKKIDGQRIIAQIDGQKKKIKKI